MTTTETKQPNTVSGAEWLINFLDLVPKEREESNLHAHDGLLLGRFVAHDGDW